MTWLVRRLLGVYAPSESPNQLYFNILRKFDVTCLKIQRYWVGLSLYVFATYMKYLYFLGIAPPVSKLPSDSPRSKPGLSPEESGGFPGAKSDFPPSKVKEPVLAVFDDNWPVHRPIEIILYI